MDAVEQQDDDVILRVRVQPKASRDSVIVEPSGRIRVALTAPPVDGAANTALVAFIAKRVGLSKSRVVVERGLKSRDKALRLEKITLDQVQQRLGIDCD